MSYKSSRAVAWIERFMVKVTHNAEGGERLSRWLVIGFIVMMFSLVLLGLGIAVAGSDHGTFLAVFGLFGGLSIRLTFQRRIHFGKEADERERLIAWKSLALGCGIVGLLIILWMLANGALASVRLWVPQSGEQWRTLAIASLAAVQTASSLAVALMQKTYVPEPDEEMEF